MHREKNVSISYWLAVSRHDRLPSNGHFALWRQSSETQFLTQSLSAHQNYWCQQTTCQQTAWTTSNMKFNFLGDSHFWFVAQRSLKMNEKSSYLAISNVLSMSFLVSRTLSSKWCMAKKSLMFPIGDRLVEGLRDNCSRNSDFSKHSELRDLLKTEVQNEFRLSWQLEWLKVDFMPNLWNSACLCKSERWNIFLKCKG